MRVNREGGDPEVSVILPCMNAAADLGDQLSALACQQGAPSWELIAVDNGSTDATIEIIETFRSSLPRLRIISEPRRGPQHARNAGAKHSVAATILFLDGDDVVGPNYVAAMAEALHHADIVGASLETGTLNDGWVRQSRDVPSDLAGRRVFDYLPFASSCALGVRREVFDAMGGFADLPVAEDIDLSWRAIEQGYNYRFVPDAVLHYRFRRSLRALVQQSWRYGMAQPRLYKLHAEHGMPASGWRDGAKKWKANLMALTRVRDRGAVARWIGRLTTDAGSTYGSLKYGTLYL